MATKKTAPALDRSLSEVQLSEASQEALSENVVEGEVVGADGSKVKREVVKLGDEEFRVADEIGIMPMLKWAAFSDMSSEDPAALAAIYAMLQDVIHEDDWTAFERHAIKTKAGAEALMDVISGGMEIITGRPTGQPGGSAAG